MAITYSCSLGQQEIYHFRSRSLDQSCWFLSALPTTGGPVVYFRLNLCSGLDICIVHLAQIVILNPCAVVQGLELCNSHDLWGCGSVPPGASLLCAQLGGQRGVWEQAGDRFAPIEVHTWILPKLACRWVFMLSSKAWWSSQYPSPKARSSIKWWIGLL